MTLQEIAEQLKLWDEVTLIDRLGVTSEEIVDRFIDIIEDRLEEFESDLEEAEDPDGSD